jgi:putative DNA primase/helicase
MTAKLLLHTNEVPTAKQVDPALENRLMFLEWCSTIPAAERDPKLREKLVAEGPGWLVRCLEAYKQVCLDLGKGATEEEALRLPQSVLDAVAAYRDDMDMVQRWLDETCHVGRGARCRRADAWRSWTDWSKENRVPRGKQQVFYSTLKGKGFEERSIDGFAMLDGLSIQTREVEIDV